MADISNIQHHDYQLSECDSRQVLKKHLLPFGPQGNTLHTYKALGCSMFFITHNQCHTFSYWLGKQFGHISHKESRQTTMFGHGKWQEVCMLRWTFSKLKCYYFYSKQYNIFINTRAISVLCLLVSVYFIMPTHVLGLFDSVPSN
jgi:hypothetical protein